jgi:hypothetical protein
MRWNEKKVGETRVKTRFLVIPKKINGKWRWLEVATWHDEYDGYRWESCGWIDEGDEDAN